MQNRVMAMLAVAFFATPGLVVRAQPTAGTLYVEKVVDINGRDTEALNERAIRVVADGHGRLILLTPVRLPPTVFNMRGEPVGSLGGRGRGPGETMWARWIDGSLDDDTIRVFEMGRVVLFSKRTLKHARTVTDAHPDCPMFLAVLRPGVHAMVSCRIRNFNNPIPNLMTVRTDTGRVLHTIERPFLNGGIPRNVFTRDLTKPRSMWLVESQERTFPGYRIVQFSEDGRRGTTYHRRPSWWTNGHVSRDNPNLPVTWPVDCRQVSPHLLLVLFSTPRSDWTRFPADPKTREGYWSRFDSAAELIDIRTGALVGAARIPGYAVSIAANDLVATYFEDEDGYPKVSIFRIESRVSRGSRSSWE